jgi:hypothetical protein
MRRSVLLLLLALAAAARADRLSDLANPNYKVDPNKSANLNGLNPFGAPQNMNLKGNTSFSKSFDTKRFNTGSYNNLPSYGGANKSFGTSPSSLQNRSFASSGKTFNVTSYTADKTFRVPATALYAGQAAPGFSGSTPVTTYYGPENPEFARSQMKERMNRKLTIEEVKELLNRNR